MDTASTILGCWANTSRWLDNQREGQRRSWAREKSAEVAQLLDACRELLTRSMRQAFPGAESTRRSSKRRSSRSTRMSGSWCTGFCTDYLQPILAGARPVRIPAMGEPVHELCACMKQRIMDEENRGRAQGRSRREQLSSST